MVDNERVSKIKELYKKGNYEEIAGEVNNDYRIVDIINNYNQLSEQELIITAISYYLYRKDNPLEEITWNFQKKKVNLASEMFHLAKLDAGIEELFRDNNVYFINNIKEIIDDTFLSCCTSKSIMSLYNNGYDKLIIDGVKNHRIIRGNLIKELLNDNKFKNEIITRDFLMYFYNGWNLEYFINLPDDRKHLVSCYGKTSSRSERVVNGNINDNFIFLLKNNYPYFDDDIVNKVLYLYDKLSYNVVGYVLRELEKNINYLDKVVDIADKYFNGKIDVVIYFKYNYPTISKKIFCLDKIDNVLINKINDVSDLNTLELLDELSIDEFRSIEIDRLAYKIDECDNNFYDMRISPFSDKDCSLFMYSKAIIKIDNRGFLSEYMVIDSHEGMLRYIYGGRDKNITQVLYDANMMGDILFVIENTALIIWLPSSMIIKQRDKVLEKLDEIKNRDDVSVYVGIANPNHNCNYVMINDGMDISLDKAIDSVKRIKIRNDKNKTLVKG